MMVKLRTFEDTMKRVGSVRKIICSTFIWKKICIQGTLGNPPSNQEKTDDQIEKESKDLKIYLIKENFKIAHIGKCVPIGWEGNANRKHSECYHTPGKWIHLKIRGEKWTETIRWWRGLGITGAPRHCRWGYKELPPLRKQLSI